MDVFNAIWDNPDQSKRPSHEGFQLFSMEEWFSYSSTYKILSGSFNCPLPPEVESGKTSAAVNKMPSLEDKVNIPSKVKCDPAQQPKKYIPGLLKSPILNRLSVLTQEQHQECLRLLLKFDGRSTNDFNALERTEYQLFQSLYLRAREEQKEFLDVAKASWPDFVDRSQKLKKNLDTLMDRLWMAKVERTLSRYPKKYKKLKMMALTSRNKVAIEIHHIKNLLNIGRIPLVRLPELDRAFRIATDIMKLRGWTRLSVPHQQTAGTLHKVPVSGDPNAERLARQHCAQAVISSSGLKCLLELHEEGKEKAWKLPIYIKEHRTFENGLPTSRKVVFIDKPVPSMKQVGSEKVSKYHKHALMAAVVHRHSGGLEFDIKGEEFVFRKTHDLESQSSFHDDSENQLEFQSSASPASIKSGPSCLEAQKLSSSVLSSHVPHDFKASSHSESDICDNDTKLVGVDCVKQNASGLSSASGLSAPISNARDCSDSDDDDTDDESKLVMDVDVEAPQKIESPRPVEPLASSHGLISGSNGNVDSFYKFWPTLNDVCAEEGVDVSARAPLLKGKDFVAAVDESSETRRKLEEVDSIPVSQLHENGGDECEKTSFSESAATPVRVVDGYGLPLCDTNVTYNLWTLLSNVGKCSSQQASSSKPINVIVRTSIHGCESLGKGDMQPVCIASKPEFQLEFGPEVVSLSELSRQWIDLKFRPNALLTRVRVNVANCDMVKVERRTAAEVKNEAQLLYNVDVSATLPVLHCVLSEVMNLDCGEYLLSKIPKDGHEAELFVASKCDEEACLDIAVEYKKSSTLTYDSPWQPLDATVIMPKNVFFNTIPCTFQPAPKNRLMPKWTVSRMERIPKTFPASKKTSKKKKKKKKKNRDMASAQTQQKPAELQA